MKRQNTTTLTGLKAADLVTEELPRLTIVLVPNFWGSHERRWERAKNHLVPLVMHGWDQSDFALCGASSKANDSECDLSKTYGPNDPLPSRLCKKCQRIALKRGYGNAPG